MKIALTSPNQAAHHDVLPSLAAAAPAPALSILAVKRLPLPLRLAAGVAGGLGVAAAAVAITASAAGVQVHLNAGAAGAPVAVAGAPSASPVVTPSPFSIMPRSQTAAAPARALTAPMLIPAEAQVLGVTPRQLTADLKTSSLSQLAAAKGLTASQFGARLAPLLQPQLDQQVAGQQLTAAQEQALLRQLQAGQIPNWTAVARAN